MGKIIAFLETWTESERGWGTRPDGCSLHASREACADYIKEYWDSMPDDTPDEYSRPDNNVIPVEITDELQVALVESTNGIRIWERKYSDLVNNGDIKKL